MRTRLILGLLLLVSSVESVSVAQTVAASQPQKIVYVDASGLRHNPNNRYFGQLLDLALSKSVPEYGTYRLSPLDINISQKRQLRELERGTIDVFWTMTSYAREVEARPVRIPLTKGMYGIRLLAINGADRDAIAAITQMPQLAGLMALQGRDWPDTQVLRLNRLEVNTDIAEPELYSFLARHPGHYFPRSVMEIFSELDSRSLPQVEADSTLALVYPAAMYFFVARDNLALAQRLEYGLTLAQADGSFDALFYGFGPYKEALERAQLNKRRLLYLDNPLIPKSANAAAIRAIQDEIIGHQ
jgi:hypothetical protein